MITLITAPTLTDHHAGCATNLLRTTPAAALTFTSFELIARTLRQMAADNKAAAAMAAGPQQQQEGQGAPAIGPSAVPAPAPAGGAPGKAAGGHNTAAARGLPSTSLAFEQQQWHLQQQQQQQRQQCRPLQQGHQDSDQQESMLGSGRGHSHS
jgi:hypothetical protein